MKSFIVWILIFGAFVFLTLNRHSRTGVQTYQSEIWADKAGYYVYLPSLFIYGFNASAFPDSIDAKTGNGFQFVDDKVVTKYNYGVALMQMPFFLIADILAGKEGNGFSLIYHRAIDIAAVFYLVTGLFLLFRVLRIKYSLPVCAITLIAVLFGTNLFYYAVIDTGMSHIYSFALFSLFLFLLINRSLFENRMILFVIFISFLASLMIVIRPTSILYIVVVFIITHQNVRYFYSYFKWEYLTVIAVTSIIVFLPQLLYWNYLTGSSFYYSYGNESFVNWNNPQLLKSLFSPNNGLLLYNPLILLMLIGIFIMIMDHLQNGWIFGILFVTLLYVVSSWWSFSFGCGYGSRNFVEYYSVFSIPLAYFISVSKEKKSVMFFVSVLMIIVFVSYNMKMIYTWDRCWFGNNDWDWCEYLQLVTSGTH